MARLINMVEKAKQNALYVPSAPARSAPSSGRRSTTRLGSGP